MPAASNKQERLEEMKKEVDELARSAGSAAELMRNIVKLLHDQMLKYNWVGFYMLAKSPAEQSPMLVLGAFQGAMTPGQLFAFRPVPGYARYRTPIRGLYLCGSAAHPGGGVMGTPGLNAAREILGRPVRRHRRRPASRPWQSRSL